MEGHSERQKTKCGLVLRKLEIMSCKHPDFATLFLYNSYKAHYAVMQTMS